MAAYYTGGWATNDIGTTATTSCASDTVWYSWATSNTGTSCASDTVWYNWVGIVSTSTCTTSMTTDRYSVWRVWNDVGFYDPHALPSGADALAEQVRRQAVAQRQAAEQEAELQAAAQERQEKQAAANKRAMELLREHLSEKQRNALDKHGWFLVEGGKSGKTYKIQGDRCAGNIYEMNGKVEVTRFCVHAAYNIPLGDQLLAQAMSIRWDEDHLVKTANKTALQRAA
jgi:hypothetical protein